MPILSRRAISYHLNGLSFREFLLFEHNLDLSPLTLEDILTKHQTIAGVEKFAEVDPISPIQIDPHATIETDPLVTV